MKKRHIDPFAKTDLTEEEQDALLKPLFKQHFDQENKAKWAEMLAKQGVVRDAPAPVVLSVWKRYRAAAAIALLVLATGIGWWYWASTASDPRQLALAQIELGEPIRLSGTSRGSNDTQAARSPQAYAAYEQKNYPEAIRLLSAEPLDSLNAANRLLLGLCYVYLPDYAQAISILDSVHPALSGTEREVARWYLALARVQMGQTAQAKSLLDSLRNTPGGLYRSPAQDLLRRL